MRARQPVRNRLEGTPLLKTIHPDIFRLGTDVSLPDRGLTQAIKSLIDLVQAGDPEAMIDFLEEWIPGSSIREGSQPEITFVI